MAIHVDLTGKKFNRWTVESFACSVKGHKYYNCVCDCGTRKVVCGNNVKRGLSKSCGCLNSEMAANHCVEMSRHGLHKTRIYRIWEGMKRRCQTPSVHNFRDYGGRGITVCDEWQEFVPFYEWAINNGYSEELTLDRIDVNGNYEPGNCRWATWSEQSRNKRPKEQIERDRRIYG